MNKLELYKLIRKNQRLALRRHPMFERGMLMKVMMYVMIAFWAVYLMWIAVALANGLKDGSRESYDVVNGGMIIFLAIDFFLRFTMQETPAQDIKPYKLLPISENFLHNIFLVRIGLNWYNVFWHCFFIPFGLISIYFTPYFGFQNLVTYLIGVWLLFVLNAYWYLLWRTLVNRNVLWLGVPICFYAALIYFGMVRADWAFYAQMRFCRGFITMQTLPFLATITTIIILFLINRQMQKRSVFFEISKTETVKKVRSQEMSFLNRYGVVGEYLKLEIKSIMRNPVVRKNFLSGVFAMISVCVLLAFTPVYDNGFMHVYVCVYCFVCLGVIVLTNVMGVEGNYIDGLMARRESVLALLKAKYYFNCMLMIVPLLFCIAPIINGKMSVLEILGYMCFSAGVVFPFLFQMAVYNNSTISLTEKMTRNNANTKMQLIVAVVALFVPMLIIYILLLLFSVSVSSIIIFIIGVLGIALTPQWMRNIYKRFMKRRYANMSGFRSTR